MYFSQVGDAINVEQVVIKIDFSQGQLKCLAGSIVQIMAHCAFFSP